MSRNLKAVEEKYLGIWEKSVPREKVNAKSWVKNRVCGGAWVAQSVKCLPLTQVTILVPGLSPCRTPCSVESLLLSLFITLLVRAHSLSLSQINKILKKKNRVCGKYVKYLGSDRKVRMAREVKLHKACTLCKDFDLNTVCLTWETKGGFWGVISKILWSITLLLWILY